MIQKRDNVLINNYLFMFYFLNLYEKMFLANQSISFLLKNYLQKYRLTFCVLVAFLAGVAGEERGDFEV